MRLKFGKFGGMSAVSLAVSFTAGIVLLSACSGGQLIIERVVTNTPDPNVIIVTITPAGGSTDGSPTAAALVPTDSTNTDATQTAGPITNDSTPTTPVPSVSVVPSDAAPTTQINATPTLSAFPTEVRAPIFIAQQNFERGYMFWIEPQKVIWVLVEDVPGNKNSGVWYIYRDTFVEGETEVDPSLTPPDSLYQPRRGFGKLWRETEGLRDALGWATTPEFGLNTNYVYQPGGKLDETGNYIPGPGKHFVTTLGREIFALSEPDPATGANGRWERVG